MKFRFLKYLYYKYYYFGSGPGNSKVGWIFSMNLTFLFYGVVMMFDILLAPKSIQLPGPFWVIGTGLLLYVALTIVFFFMDWKKYDKDEDKKMESYKEEFKNDSNWPAIIVGVAPFVFMFAMCYLKMLQNRGVF